MVDGTVTSILHSRMSACIVVCPTSTMFIPVNSSRLLCHQFILGLPPPLSLHPSCRISLVNVYSCIELSVSSLNCWLHFKFWHMRCIGNVHHKCSCALISIASKKIPLPMSLSMIHTIVWVSHSVEVSLGESLT